jgi:hypothetical protein
MIALRLSANVRQTVPLVAMGLELLTPDERGLVYRCVAAAVDGPFFPDWEFETLFGLARGEARSVATAWPDIDESTEAVSLTINNAFANLLGYPHHEDAAWALLISSDRSEVERVFLKWRGGASIQIGVR